MRSIGGRRAANAVAHAYQVGAGGKQDVAVTATPGGQGSTVTAEPTLVGLEALDTPPLVTTGDAGRNSESRLAGVGPRIYSKTTSSILRQASGTMATGSEKQRRTGHPQLYRFSRNAM